MNDLYLQQKGAAPLLLMGIAGSRRRSGSRYALERTAVGDNDLFHREGRPAASQESSRLNITEATLFRGRSHLTILEGEPGVQDMTEVFADAERWFVALGRRRGWVRLEQILGLTHHRQKHPDIEEEPLFGQLSEIRMALETQLTTALILLERCEAAGTWNKEVYTLRDAARRAFEHGMLRARRWSSAT